jgi:acetolactate synthase-1/2/3 large subunit
MSQSPDPRTGGQVLIDALKIHGVDTVFCVPGESYLAALDALAGAGNTIRTITCRHEGGAAYMAEAYGKLTGKPGVVMVTRGPGACHASVGVHTGFQDSTPMLVLIGQVARDCEYREAFQEIDYHTFYAPLCKWVAQIESAERIPELVSQAMHRACSGRAGPVALALPEDMLTDKVSVADVATYQRVQPGVEAGAIDRMRTLLAKAQRPLVIAGGGGWSKSACHDLRRFAEANNLPTGAAFRNQDRLDNHHDNYIGPFGVGASPDIGALIRQADLVIAIGARLGEATSPGYTLLTPPRSHQQLVHVHPDSSEPGRVYQADVAICASVENFLHDAAAMAPVDHTAWDKWTTDARAAYLEDLKPTPGLPGDLDMGAVMAHLRECLPADAILTTDAGNFSTWMHRHYQYTDFPTQLGPTNGSMGYGVPAAIAARIVHPDRPVVAFVGDGGMLMTGQEIATALHHGIDPGILVINNNMYGTIRMHQERDYPERVHGTSLSNPDFAEWARSFGAHGERVTRTEEFAPAFERASKAGKVAVIELCIDPDVISTRTTLSAVREGSRGRTPSP